MPLLCIGKNDKKLGPEDCLVQDFLFVMHSKSLGGLGFLYIITLISCTIYFSTGKQLQFLFIHDLFEMQSLHWLTLLITVLKWFKKHKGKNIFIPEALSMCLVFQEHRQTCSQILWRQKELPIYTKIQHFRPFLL
jgi:hypothetical protein